MLLECLSGVRIDEQLIGDADRAVRALERVKTAPNMTDKVTAFHQETNQIIRELRTRLTSETLDDLVLTRRYWEIVTFPYQTRAKTDLIDLEVEDGIERFKAACRDTRAELARWGDAGSVVVPDTNVFLHVLGTLEPVRSAGWHALAGLRDDVPVTVVLVLKVLDERDRHKRTRNRVQAKAVLRELQPMIEEGTPTPMGDGLSFDVLVPPRQHVALPDADNEILDQASRLHSRLPKPIEPIIVTADLGMVARARLAGIRVVRAEDRDTP